jgi:hypothetical protein
MEDGRSARLRHCTGHVHASILFCWHTQTQTRRMHTPHHQSSITNNNNNSSTAQQPPSRASQPRDLPGWGHVRGHILLRPSRRNSLSRTMQLDGASGLRAVRDSANASRNWLQQAEQRRTMMASASLGGGALAAVDSACAARARGTLLSLLSPIWVVIARQPLVSVIWPALGWLSNRILPEAALCDVNYIAVMCVCMFVPNTRI